LTMSHHPETESPKFRGELSSIWVIACKTREVEVTMKKPTEPTSDANTTLAPIENIVDT
jgi:hypothetical protein